MPLPMKAWMTWHRRSAARTGATACFCLVPAVENVTEMSQRCTQKCHSDLSDSAYRQGGRANRVTARGLDGIHAIVASRADRMDAWWVQAARQQEKAEPKRCAVAYYRHSADIGQENS